MKIRPITVISLLIAILILVFSHSIASNSAGAVVSVSESGFSPDYVEVQVGQSVTWINQGSNEHWPASNFHPTHTAYPGSGIEKCGTSDESGILDACHGLKPDEKYTFALTK